MGDNDIIISRIVNTYGTDNQLFLLFEELGELIEAVNHYRRNKTNKQRVIEELADTEFMLEQLKYMFNLSNYAIQDVKERNITRLTTKLNNIKKRGNDGIC